MTGETGEVLISGEGPPVVLVHGVGLDHTMWDRIIDPLSTNRTVVRFDLLGHGTTADPPGARTLDDFVDQLCAVIDLVGGQPVAVVGSSLGALISLATAARHTERVAALVVANIIYGRTAEQQTGVNRRLALTEAEGMGPVADLAIDRWFSSEWQTAHPDLVTQVATRLRTNDAAAYLKAYRVLATTDLASDGSAGQVTCPTLAVTGELDTGSTPAMTTELGRAVADGTSVVLDGLRHLPSIEDPDRFASTISDFLDGAADRVA